LLICSLERIAVAVFVEVSVLVAAPVFDNLEALTSDKALVALFAIALARTFTTFAGVANEMIVCGVWTRLAWKLRIAAKSGVHGIEADRIGVVNQLGRCQHVAGRHPSGMNNAIRLIQSVIGETAVSILMLDRAV
jgi:hypothetical protein